MDRTKASLLAYHMGNELISKHLKKPTCVIAGIHIENITKEEIDRVLDNLSRLVDEFITRVSK